MGVHCGHGMMHIRSKTATAIRYARRTVCNAWGTEGKGERTMHAALVTLSFACIQLDSLSPRCVDKSPGVTLASSCLIGCIWQPSCLFLLFEGCLGALLGLGPLFALFARPFGGHFALGSTRLKKLRSAAGLSSWSEAKGSRQTLKCDIP